MKRVISSTIVAASRPDVFKMDTDVSYYNSFLNDKDHAYMQKSKNRTGKIIYMTPAEYYRACANKVFNNVSVAELKRQRSSNASNIKQYKEDMLSGDKFPLCYLNFADKSQEGLHRMMALGEAFGWDVEAPVLVVTAVDDRREQLDKVWRYFNDAIYYAQDYKYSPNDWEQEIVNEIEFELERRCGKHYDVVIVEKRDKEECERLGMDYGIEIALDDFKDIMRPITIFEPEFKEVEEDDDDDFEISDDDLDIEDDDIDWDSLTATL